MSDHKKYSIRFKTIRPLVDRLDLFFFLCVCKYSKGCSFSLVYWLLTNEDPFLIDLLILQIDNCSEDETKKKKLEWHLKPVRAVHLYSWLILRQKKPVVRLAFMWSKKDEEKGKKNAISCQVIQVIPENTLGGQENSLRLTRLDYISCVCEMCIGKQHYIHISNKGGWKLTVISFHQNCSIAFEVWEWNWRRKWIKLQRKREGGREKKWEVNCCLRAWMQDVNVWAWLR